MNGLPAAEAEALLDQPSLLGLVTVGIRFPRTRRRPGPAVGRCVARGRRVSHFSTLQVGLGAGKGTLGISPREHVGLAALARALVENSPAEELGGRRHPEAGRSAAARNSRRHLSIAITDAVMCSQSMGCPAIVRSRRSKYSCRAFCQAWWQRLTSCMSLIGFLAGTSCVRTFSPHSQPLPPVSGCRGKDARNGSGRKQTVTCGSFWPKPPRVAPMPQRRESVIVRTYVLASMVACGDEPALSPSDATAQRPGHCAKERSRSRR